MYVVEQEVNYKNHHHFVAIDLLVEEKELPKDEGKKDPIGLSERQPIVRSELLENGGTYEGIRRVILAAHEMDYKNHPHFTIICRLVEESELPQVGQNDDKIEIVGETADCPQQITQRRQQLQEHSMGDSCSPQDRLQESPPLYNNPPSG